MRGDAGHLRRDALADAWARASGGGGARRGGGPIPGDAHTHVVDGKEATCSGHRKAVLSMRPRCIVG